MGARDGHHRLEQRRGGREHGCGRHGRHQAATGLNPDQDEFGEAGIDIGALIQPGERQALRDLRHASAAASRTSGESTSANMVDLVGPAPIDISNCATPTIATTQHPDVGCDR